MSVRRAPRSTYRLQLRQGVTLDDARDLVGYLHECGVHWLYLSPVFAARRDSTHGYDVIGPNRIDPRLGTEDSLRALAGELHSRGMGLMLDIVPNHMAQSLENPWWVELLTHGPGSANATVFDVDFSVGKILIPVLGEPYGEALERGLLTAEADALVYGGMRFPLAPGTAGETDPDALHAKQHYRLAWWRLANESINYRRFFDINDLVCVRLEDEQVLGRTHELLDRIVGEGIVDGLRVDHVDGLADPGRYLRTIAGRYPSTTVVVEKILGEGEALPPDWPVAGTTGYEFITAAEGLFHDAEGLRALRASWADFTGDGRSFEQTKAEAKREVVESLFGAEVEALTRGVAERTEHDLLGRDIPVGEIREAIVRSVVALPVYRTYGRIEVDGDGYAARFVRRCLERDAGLRTRWEQLTGPAMAKGLEDTTLYRYTVCLSRNEVGGDPGGEPFDVEAFHRINASRSRGSLNAGSTHDTKRSEDVRARIAVLTERPDLWAAAVSKLHRLTHAEGRVDPAMEWFCYQTLAGTWEGSAGKGYVTRITDTLRKAAREAKTFTSWVDPDEAAEERMLRWARATMRSASVRAELDRILKAIAWPAAINSLAALVLRVCSPGVPDVYNGTELWDRRLVDPDNRSAVDFARRRRMLQDPRDAATVVKSWEDGAIKMFVLRRALAAGADGFYTPLRVRGPLRHNVVAFARRSGQNWTLVAVPRLVARLVKPGRMPDWRTTSIELPAGAPRTWLNVFTGEEGSGSRVGDLLGTFPVAVLTATGTSRRGSPKASSRR